MGWPMSALAPPPAAARAHGSLQAVLEETLAVVPEPRTTAGARKADPFFPLVTRTLRDAVAAIVQDEQTYKIEGSVGRGNWAETPWVSVFDLNITDSATRGVYLVYLIREDGTRVYLSLNQGCTSVRREAGSRYRQVLEGLAQEYAEFLPQEERVDLMTGPISLGEGRTDLTPGYESGNIAAIAYDRDAVPRDDVLASDLRRMLTLYSLLAEGLEQVPIGELDAVDPDMPAAYAGEWPSLEETRQFRHHRRAEGRNSRAAKLAKSYHGYRCQVCDVDYVERLGNKLGRRCVDAHHLVPFAELDERPKRIKATDFAIVCATCHRLLHSTTPPLTIETARVLMAQR
jgi:5-methylcytosine-specific restriction protein A